MPTTTKYALRYPASTDPADVPTDMQHLAADVDAALGGKTTTSLMSGGPPSSPSDGDIWIATAVDANGTRWQFQYNAGSASAYKWEFIGGAPLSSQVLTYETTTGTSYTALATAGPSVTLARPGDYDVETSATIVLVATGTLAYMSYDIGATGAVDVDGVELSNQATGGANTDGSTVFKRKRKTGLGAVTLTAKYRGGGAANGYVSRYIAVTPVRVS